MIIFLALSSGLIIVSMSLVFSANRELEKYAGPSRKVMDSTLDDGAETQHAANAIRNTYEPLFSH